MTNSPARENTLGQMRMDHSANPELLGPWESTRALSKTNDWSTEDELSKSDLVRSLTYTSPG